VVWQLRVDLQWHHGHEQVSTKILKLFGLSELCYSLNRKMTGSGEKNPSKEFLSLEFETNFLLLSRFSFLLGMLRLDKIADRERAKR
jgi:hypothetical protein